MAPTATQDLDIQIKDEHIPVISTIATKAIAMINGDGAGPKELEDLIRMDPSLTTRILRLANSPLYGGRVEFSSISQSVVRLGMTRLKSTIMTAATGDVIDRTDPFACAFWDHSIAVALLSELLAARLGIERAEECFVSGLLHDIGKVVIYLQEPEAYAQIVESAALEGVRFYEYERAKITYCSHETVGAMVGRKWDLSSDAVDVIRFHHEIECNPELVEQFPPMVSLVSVASMMANKLGVGTEPPSVIDVMSSMPAKRLDMTEDLYNEVCNRFEEDLRPRMASLS